MHPMLQKALDNTKHIKDYKMIMGTEGVPNFFVIHETELATIAMKLTAEQSSFQTSELCLRVRVIKKEGTLGNMDKMYNDVYADKLKEAEAYHLKHDAIRISYILSSDVKVNSDSIATADPEEVMKNLLAKTVNSLNTVFDMKITRTGFAPILMELCQISLPIGLEVLSGESLTDTKEADKKDSKKGSVTSINKNNGDEGK